MLNGLKNAFRIKELREKILFTIAMLVVYRIGAHVPVPGIPFQGMLGLFSTDNNSVAAGAMALLNLFSGGALSYVSVFSLGIMPYITSSIILQMLQAVVPSLHELAREGEVGQTKITQYSRYLTLALAILNSVGYLFLFKSFGISFNGAGAPEIIFDLMIVGTLTAGAMLIMWIGELITQRGIGNGMSLIIFANIMAGLPQAIFSSTEGNAGGIITMVIICAIILLLVVIAMALSKTINVPMQTAAIIGALACVITGCLTEKQAYGGIDWTTIFLFAGMLPLAEAMDKTGAGAMIANAVVGIIGSNASPLIIVMAMFLLSCGLTQFMSNTAAAALLAPIGISIAQSIGVSPFPVLMAIGIAASCAFTTPVATPPNTLILGPGKFRFMDYVKVGLPLVVVSMIVCTVIIPLVWPF